jgi:hypothetical protein
MALSGHLKTLDVTRALRKLSVEKTRELVFHLGAPLNDVDDIAGQYDGETRKAHFVEKWLDIDASANWNKLVSGLKEISMDSLAAEIEAKRVLRATGSAPVPVPLLPTSAARLQSASSLPQSSGAAPFSVPCPPVQPIQTPAVNPVEKAVSIPVAISPTHTPATNPIQTPAVNQQKVVQARASVEYLQDEFSDLKCEACESLSETEGKNPRFVTKFRHYLLDLPVTKKTVHIRFFSRNEDEILSAKTIEKLFAILSRHCNYTNYEIILHIVRKFCHQLKGRMTVYQDSLVSFEKTTTVDVYLCAISARPDGSIAAGFIQMAMKINKPPSVCTLYEIRQLKESIEENASIESYCMYIQTPEEGSVRIVLRVPEQVKLTVFEVFTPAFREAHSLSEVTVGENLDNKLHRAIQRGDKEGVTLLIKAGADVDSRSSWVGVFF